MRIAILPAIGTDWAVAEIDDGTLPIEIRSPRKLAKGEIELLIGRLYADVCRYKFELDLFKHLAYLVPFWGLASGLALYFSFKQLFGIALPFGLLWGWNLWWLLGDGIWLTIMVVMKGPQWWRARKAFKSLGEHWAAEVVVGKGLVAIASEQGLVEWWAKPQRGPTENEWIKAHMKDKEFGHLYARLLRRYPSRYFDLYPYGGGAGAHIANMVRGVPVRRPWLVYPVAKEAR